MSYKRIDPQDIIVGHGSVVVPMGNNPGGACADGVEYDTFTIDKSGTDEQIRRYKQIANLILKDPLHEDLPLGTSMNVILFNRKYFKGSIHPASFEVNTYKVDTTTEFVQHSEGGRVFKTDPRVGSPNLYLYPDIGLALTSTTVTNVFAASEEISNYSQIFIRARNSEFNYSMNPSFLGMEGDLRFTSFIDNPKTYITTIGLYNDEGDLLAVSKTEKPIEKDFNNEAFFTLQLKY